MSESTLTLLDDGTLDTVFQCDLCGEELRFSQEFMAEYRDESGALKDTGFEVAGEFHEAECLHA